MNPTKDYTHETPGPFGSGVCRVRIYEPTRSRHFWVVVLTEPVRNPGISITNSIERVAAWVVLQNALPSSHVVWIEHYLDGGRGTLSDPETFDLVTFASDEPEARMRSGRWVMEMGEPDWSPSTREGVETLLGFPFESEAREDA